MASVHDALDLVDGKGLAADRQQRRRLGEIDRTDDALYPSTDGHRVTGGVLRRRRERIIAVWPLGAIVALAVPGERLVIAGVHGEGPAENRLTAAVGDADIDIRTGSRAEL